MRRLHTVVVVVLVVAGTLALAGPVAADPPSTSVSDNTDIFCLFDSDVGDVEFFAYQGTGADGGEEWEESEAFVFIFLAEEETEVVTDNPFDVDFEGDAFTAELALVFGETGEPAGTALVAGMYEQVGDFEVVEEWSGKSGNVREIGMEARAPLAVSGDLTVMLDGYDPLMFDLAECGGELIHDEIWHTNPTSQIFRSDGTEMFCSLEQDGWVVELFAFGERDESFLDLVAWSPDAAPFEEEPTYFGFAEQFGLNGFGALEVEVPLFEPLIEEPTEVALIEAALSEGDVFNIDARFQDGWLKVVETALVVEGTLTLPEITLDMSGCEGVNYAFQQHLHPDQSQGKGKVPANDLPEGAIELTNRTNVQTRMASEAPEAACIDPEWGDMPLGKTVWYHVEGNGEEMTVDTAGTDFDTVVGIYVMEEGELLQEACLDDNVDEAGVRNVVALTFETEVATTYYVQIGGFGGQYGHLKVALR